MKNILKNKKEKFIAVKVAILTIIFSFFLFNFVRNHVYSGDVYDKYIPNFIRNIFIPKYDMSNIFSNTPGDIEQVRAERLEVKNFCSTLKNQRQDIEMIKKRYGIIDENNNIRDYYRNIYQIFSFGSYTGDTNKKYKQEEDKFLPFIDYKKNPSYYCELVGDYEGDQSKKYLYFISDKELIEIADLSFIFEDRKVSPVIVAFNKNYVYTGLSRPVEQYGRYDLVAYDVETKKIKKLKPIDYEMRDGMGIDYTAMGDYILQNYKDKLYLYNFKKDIRYFVSNLPEKNYFRLLGSGTNIDFVQITDMVSADNKYVKFEDVINSGSESVFLDEK